MNFLKKLLKPHSNFTPAEQVKLFVIILLVLYGMLGLVWLVKDSFQ